MHLGYEFLCIIFTGVHSKLAKIYYINSFYALGDSMDFKKGQKIDLEVAKMFSLRTQLSYEYYSLPFCLPKNGTLSYKSENLGEMLRGDIIVNTPYEVAMAQNISCKLLCDKPTEPMTWKESNSLLIIERIQQEYIVHLLIDDFTAASLTYLNDKIDIQPGYYLGGIDEKNRVYINNYLKLKLAYHKYGENKFRIVCFIVEALSVDYKQVGYKSGTCNIPPQASPQYVNPNGVLPFSIVFIDLVYIVTALWQNYLYVVSEFLFIVFIYLIISCSETFMIIFYLHLCKEDYRWWWRCFMYSGASAAYIQAFSIYFFFIETNITELVPTLMYFAYMSLIAITFWLLTGTISFFAAFIFIRKIYAAIKLA